MNRLLRTTFAILACLHLCGGHWGVLQVVAWSRMIVEYSAKEGVLVGTKKTFDGEHPCHMCKSIAKGKTDESKNEKPALPGSQSLEMLSKAFVPADDSRLAPPGWTEVMEVPAARFLLSHGGREECPPVPPPRCA
ncbi:MAG: hypothetical protein EOP85_16735 [Verrucomicrobiaceae bacterium]|nr:MAG: hypothetical protein EOP85_16735 [Verrucomicrobiaceae bacterium]